MVSRLTSDSLILVNGINQADSAVLRDINLSLNMDKVADSVRRIFRVH